MSTAEKIFQKTQTLPESAQDAILHVVEQFALQYPPHTTEPLTLHEAAEVRVRSPHGRRTGTRPAWRPMIAIINR